MSPDEPLGILSRTINTSPTIRWILPARVRDERYNDVVFVGETSVQLREFLPTGQLADATAKIDMGAHILAVKILSSKAKEISILDQIIKKEHDHKAPNLHGHQSQPLSPQEILVITTAAGEVIFLYATNFEPGRVDFVYAKKRVNLDTSLLERYGSFLAIDLESRAMAVAPAYGYCGLFTLKPINSIQTAIKEWNPLLSFAPTSEDRFIRVDGLILKMDFLSSPSNARDKILLLLLVAQAGHSYILIYSWDTRIGPGSAKPVRCSGQRLPLEDSIPLMLIPSTRWTSFIIATESGLVVYDNIMSLEAKRISLPLPNDFPPKYESSSRNPLWVQWAKPMRHSKYMETHDDIYLVREDGELLYCEINHPSPNKVDAHFSPGNLRVSVDTAFATLEGPLSQGGDTIIAGGDQTDGGVFHCRPRTNAECIQTLPNLAPVHDMLTINTHDHKGSRSLRNTDRQERVFVCSGKGTGHAAVTEIRFGLEAQVGLAVDQDDCSTVNNLWVLPESATERLLFLSSYPLSSSALLLSVTTLGLELVESDICLGLDLGQTTLAAAAILDGLIMQVTPSALLVTASLFDAPLAKQSLSTWPAVVACINATDSTFVVGVKANDAFELHLGAINAEDQQVQIDVLGSPFKMTQEPISLAFTKLGSLPLLCAGMSDGVLQILHVKPREGLSLVQHHKMDALATNVETSAISTIVSLRHQNEDRCLLLCGLRNGNLTCLGMQLNSTTTMEKLEIHVLDYHKLGRTTVSVRQDSVDSTAALVLCGSELRRLRLAESTDAVRYSMESIWLVDRQDPAYQQPSINTACRVQAFSYLWNSSLGGSLACLTDGQLLVSSMMLQPQCVPRRMRTRGNPQKMVYSKYLDKLVVALDRVSFPPTKDKEARPRRCIRPSLQFLSPDGEVGDHIGSITTSDRSVLFGDAGEIITNLLNWTPTDGQKHFEMIVIGTNVDAKDTMKASGRIVYVNAKQRERSMEVKVKSTFNYPGQPISSMCAFGLSSLVICAGNELILQSLDVASRRWSTICKSELPSAALSLSTTGSFINVATLYHSFLVYKLEERELELFAHDSRAGNVIQVVPFGSGLIVTSTSDQGGLIVGLSEPIKDQVTPAIFGVALPLTVNCLKQSYAGTTMGEGRKHLLGSTLDGTIYRFTTLSYDEWRLLHFLEYLIEKEVATVRRDKPIQRRGKKVSQVAKKTRREMHVRGDVLSILLQRGTENIRMLLEQKPDPEDLEEVFDTAEERIAHFELLARKVLGQKANPIAAVADWARQLL